MKHASPHTTSKILALMFVLALVLVGVFATTATANPDNGGICSDCHRTVGAAPTVQIVSTGVDSVTYSVHQTSDAWAAFDLSSNSKRIGGDSSSDSNFTAPLGHYVRVCSSNGSATGTFTQAYFVTPRAPNHGSTTPSTPQVVAPGGSSPEFTFTADPGYHLTDVKVNGVSDASALANAAYTFTNVQADSTVAATFAADVTNYTITPTAGSNGTISPATPQTVAGGSNLTFTVTPNTGYQVDTFTVDSAPATLAAGGQYTFSNVAGNHSIAVTFKTAAPVKCTATISLTGLKSGVLRLHHSVTIKGVIKPAHSGNATITIQRKAGTKWVAAKTIARAMNATSGVYGYGYKPTKTGTYRVKTSVPKTALYAAATTAYKTFKVK